MQQSVVGAPPIGHLAQQQQMHKITPQAQKPSEFATIQKILQTDQLAEDEEGNQQKRIHGLTMQDLMEKLQNDKHVQLRYKDYCKALLNEIAYKNMQ